jgi:hypothetical protein
MYKMMYSKQNINNGAMSGAKPMPLKDSTSDSQSSFNMARHTYVETIPVIPNTVEQQIQKKWFGNRDASNVVANRRNVAVGKGSLNAGNGLYAFTAYNEINVTDSARRRARAGGSVAPPKKNARTTNAPTPSFSPIQYKSVNGMTQNQYIKDFYGNNAPHLHH